jgi:zona occludens toxin
MAINVYCGLQGSGKSYEVVSSVILDAVLKGRRVVTNVAGIDEERIHAYLVERKGVERSALGVIVHVANDRLVQPDFFPDEEKAGQEAIVKGGDLVAIDEAWRFWGQDNGKLSHEHMQFFRMHRHYVHPETSVACDVVLMTQDVTGLHRSVKNVVEFTFRMQKHKSLGLTKRYRVDIYEGWKINSRTRIDHRQCAYDPAIFPLYLSYAGGKGQESAIDKRQNIFANRTLWVYAGLAVACAATSIYFVLRFFTTTPASKPIAGAANSARATASTAGPQQAPTRALPAMSETWRISGSIDVGSERWVVVSDASGRIRLESPSLFHGTGPAMIGEVDGEKVSTWAGPLPSSSKVATEALSR